MSDLKYHLHQYKSLPASINTAEGIFKKDSYVFSAFLSHPSKGGLPEQILNSKSLCFPSPKLLNTSSAAASQMRGGAGSKVAVWELWNPKPLHKQTQLIPKTQEEKQRVYELNSASVGRERGKEKEAAAGKTRERERH